MDNLQVKITKYTLSNDQKIPAIGYGTGVVRRFYRNRPMYIKDTVIASLRSIKHMKMVRFLKNDLTIKKTIRNAFSEGYTLFDTGRLYGHSEKYLGEVLSGYSRDTYYLITKVCEDDLKRYPNARSVHDNLSISLNFLKTNYVDAYLLHFPCTEMIEMYKEIEKEYKAGRTKAIGVCNFDIDELKKLMVECEIKPMINQIELNPLYTRRELREFCKDNGIIVIAHTPTARMHKHIVESTILNNIALKYNKNVWQIIYRWHFQDENIPLVSSISSIHLKENLALDDFELTDDEMEAIESMNENHTCDRYNNKRSDCPDFIYNL